MINKKKEGNKLLELSKEGFTNLDMPKKYINSALKWLKVWLTDSMYEEYVPQIKYLIESKKWDFLLDSFYQVIPFGTGGRRGPVGIGPNRINKWTIQASAQGHSQYLIKQHGGSAKERGIVLTYDVREYNQKGVYDENLPNPVMKLKCKDLEIAAAEVYAANGIKVFIFDNVRTTPELSFAIRHLNAIAGDMFSASHNPPSDNGKKVYDEHGGQLIPPYDQELVDEVTKNVKEIKSTNFDKAKKQGLIIEVGKDVDEAYINTVCSLSLSKERNIKIAYSPLHGTGITSIYPIMQKLGFKIELDPKTSNLSGAFENVTFNIPNPEIEESFDTLKSFGDKTNKDLLLASDPDADRIGIIIKQDKGWKYLNGNEIGIILTNYGISKFKSKNKLSNDNTIIKTDVTTSLIAKIAEQNNVTVIGDLLVGFKYIGEEMNKLEDVNKMDNFILGAEESHGFIMGNYVRDKDAAGAAIWLCELAAELKKKNKTLIDHLDEIYSKYGYCYNYLTEVRLLGAKGMDQIKQIMEHLRKTNIKKFGDFSIIKTIDRWEGPPQPHLSLTDTASRNVLIYKIKNKKNTQSIKVTIRPSGTEPKVKMYFEIFGKPFDTKAVEQEKEDIHNIRQKLEKYVIKHCIKIIGIDFPDRGFLLFWQLPLVDKMKYFEIENKIVALKDLPKEKRKKELFKLLDFLGSNPVEKVDKAFKEKYKAGILGYLEI